MESWKQALAELARDRFMPLKRQAFLLCGDDSQAEDLVQEALVRAFARPLRAPGPGAAEAYVRVIMVRLFIDGARRRSRWNRAAPLLAGAQAAAALGVAEGAVKRYLSEAMARLAGRLSAAQSRGQGRDQADAS